MHPSFSGSEILGLRQVLPASLSVSTAAAVSVSPPHSVCCYRCWRMTHSLSLTLAHPRMRTPARALSLSRFLILSLSVSLSVSLSFHSLPLSFSFFLVLSLSFFLFLFLFLSLSLFLSLLPFFSLSLFHFLYHVFFLFCSLSLFLFLSVSLAISSIFIRFDRHGDRVVGMPNHLENKVNSSFFFMRLIVLCTAWYIYMHMFAGKCEGVL